MPNVTYSVVIATKDREVYLENLLHSISIQTIQPFEVIICSSGRDISQVIDIFKSKLKIVHLESTVASQVFQKKMAISKVSLVSDWVAFFDDDFLLEKETLEKAFICINNESDVERLGGLGFKVTNSSNEQSKYNSILINKKCGKVLKSGYNVGYQQSSKLIYTQWLNGASMWKSSLLHKYDNDLDSLPRSLGEDLIFSYEVSKSHNLIFCPQSKLSYQSELFPDKTHAGENFKLYFYVTLYFITRNSELSLTRFYIFQVFRLFASVTVKTSIKLEKIKHFLNHSSIILSSITILCTKNKVEFVKRKLSAN